MSSGCREDYALKEGGITTAKLTLTQSRKYPDVYFLSICLCRLDVFVIDSIASFKKADYTNKARK